MGTRGNICTRWMTSYGRRAFRQFTFWTVQISSLLGLKQSEAADVVHRFVVNADIVVENFKVGIMVVNGTLETGPMRVGEKLSIEAGKESNMH